MLQSPERPTGGMNTSTVEQMLFSQRLNLPWQPSPPQCAQASRRALPPPINCTNYCSKAEFGRGKGTEPRKPAGAGEGPVVGMGSQQTAAALHATGLRGGEAGNRAPSQRHPPVPAPLCSRAKQIPTWPEQTHLLCGSQPPGQRLCRSRCWSCWSCWLALLSQGPWRGSLQQSRLLSLAPLCLQAGAEPSLVPGVLLGSW